MAYVFLAVAIAMELSATLSLQGRHRRSSGLVRRRGRRLPRRVRDALADPRRGARTRRRLRHLVGGRGGADRGGVLYALFGEPFTRLMLVGIGFIAAGVLLVELGANH